MTRMPAASKTWSSSFFSSSARAYWKPEQPPPRTPTRRPTAWAWPFPCESMKVRTFSAAMSVSWTICVNCIGQTRRYREGPMPTTQELKERIEAALPGSEASVEDLTGGGDHFRAEVVSERFDGLSRIEQHRLVYDVFGDEVGGPIHALSIKTSTPVRNA